MGLDMSFWSRRKGVKPAVAPEPPSPAQPAAKADADPASARPKSGKPAHRNWGLRFLVLSAVAAGAGGLCWLGAMLVYYTIVFPDPQSVRTRENTPIIRILARDGTVLSERGTAHDFMPIDLLPAHVTGAVVATEDRRFYEHWGVDPAGLARAMLANLRAGRFVQGGSTITQQLAKNLFLSPERTMARKLDELALSIWLEVRLTKREILELYLNRVYFGGGAYGIEAAARRYYDKSARALNIAEAALLAGLLKAPSKYAPTASPRAAIARQRVVLRRMLDAGLLSSSEHAAALRQPIRFADPNETRSAPTGFEYAVDLALDHLPPVLGSDFRELIVETTIDSRLQRLANQQVERVLAGRGKAMRASQAALVSIDNDGGIRALVGGRSYPASQFNRATKARRQPGSVFKPFVYLAALEAGMTPDTITYDLPLTIGNWSPRNDNGTNVGALTLRQALSQSVNTVAVRLATEIGLPKVAEVAHRLGVQSTLREDPSLALGTSELTLMELVGAYGVLASGGRDVRPHIIRRVLLSSGRVLFAYAENERRQLLAPRTVGAINDMLNAALVAGTGRRAAIPRHPAAGKTGTTQDYRDAWFVGYTAHLATGVWVGNDDDSPMARVMGGNLPAEIWRAVMLDAHQGRTPMALPGTTFVGPAAAPDEVPLARTLEPEVLPWLAPQLPQRSAPLAPQLPQQNLPRSLAQRAEPAAPPPTRPQGPPLLSKDVPTLQTPPIGQRIIVEPRPEANAVQSGRMPSQSHPRDGISEAFLAQVLQPVPARNDERAVAAGSPQFDADVIRHRLDSIIDNRDLDRKEPPGLMALGANVR